METSGNACLRVSAYYLEMTVVSFSDVNTDEVPRKRMCAEIGHVGKWIGSCLAEASRRGTYYLLLK